jgi:UDP:flavonoid glycosyltransferase YjiC (YdhE family)
MIRLLSVGSRGDLQPYLAILLELQRRGHSVDDAGMARAADLKAAAGGDVDKGR